MIIITLMVAGNGLVEAAKKLNLRYVSDSIAGIKRALLKNSFCYFDPNGTPLYNQNILERIRELAIPPAWENVWISPFNTSHLQATGFDRKGRKQYIYHPQWLAICTQDKFGKLVDFAKTLPEIRNTVSSHLRIHDLNKKRVVASVVWLLEHTFIRVGNDEYAKENKSYGLTTLRNKHVYIWGSKIKFQFRGKSGIDHLVSISHPAVAKTIKKCIELPGYELFKCIDEDGSRHIIDSEDVNNFLKETSGQEITAKDFRTWGATVLAASSLNRLGLYGDEKELKDKISEAVGEVSRHLRNTASVCRKYYIHPAVITTYSKNILIPHFQKSIFQKLGRLRRDEYRVLTLLQKYG